MGSVTWQERMNGDQGENTGAWAGPICHVASWSPHGAIKREQQRDADLSWSRGASCRDTIFDYGERYAEIASQSASCCVSEDFFFQTDPRSFIWTTTNSGHLCWATLLPPESLAFPSAVTLWKGGKRKPSRQRQTQKDVSFSSDSEIKIWDTSRGEKGQFARVCAWMLLE